VAFVVEHPRAGPGEEALAKQRLAAHRPIQEPVKFDFVVNLKTAQELNLTIPPTILARADKVIE